MFRILSKPFIDAIKVTAQGSTVVLLSTGLSCVLAVFIESSAHKLQYKLFPHWYKDVKFALGLPHLQYNHEQQSYHQHEQDDLATSSIEWSWSTTGAIMKSPKEFYFDDLSTTNVLGYRSMEDEDDDDELIDQQKCDDLEPKPKVPILQDRILFESYHNRLQSSKADLFSPERASKMVHTTAMTM